MQEMCKDIGVLHVGWEQGSAPARLPVGVGRGKRRGEAGGGGTQEYDVS